MGVKKKIKNARGFTLAETLLAMLILLLVSIIVANGVPIAKEAYNKVVIGANAKVLLSTTIASLRDELTTARDVVVDSSGKTITFYSADKGATSTISLSENDPTGTKIIMIEEYTDKDPITGNPIYSDSLRSKRNLVSNAAANNDLYVTFDGVTSDSSNTVVEFQNLAVYRKKDANSESKKYLEHVSSLKIKVITSNIALSVTPTTTP